MSKNESTGHNHSIAGSWMGQYFYLGTQTGSAFEVVFVEIGDHVEGSILDNGRLGEAMVTGSFTYPSLKFTKKYFRSGLDPVDYRGDMNEEGTRLSGNWFIRPAYPGAGSTMGTWVAVRGDNGEEFTLKSDHLANDLSHDGDIDSDDEGMGVERRSEKENKKQKVMPASFTPETQ